VIIDCLTETAAERVLKKHPKAVAHMWRQHRSQRFGLIFGAGASAGLGFPKWDELVSRIHDHPQVNGHADACRQPVLVGADSLESLPTATQVLFEHFRQQRHEAASTVSKDHRHVDQLVRAEWRSIVHEALYRDAPWTEDGLLERDKLYQHFLAVIRKSPLTVTYNFDDSIERLLLHCRTSAEKEKGRGFDVVVDGRLPFRARIGNVFHPNGYLPLNRLEGVGDYLALADSDFADQLTSNMTGAYSTLLHNLTKYTFLLVGVSLQDETLRHILHQNALMNPGHYHYRVHYVHDADDLCDSDFTALADAHFDTYNLVTLPLTGDEIAGLGDLLSMEARDLREAAGRRGIGVFYSYYLTGVPGAGKTSCFRHLSSLVAHDEWHDERLGLLSKAWPDLPPDERETVDEWIARQVCLKNLNLANDALDPGIGINIVDRCPLDAITFTDPDEWAQKAAALFVAIADEFSRRSIVPGQVIVITGDPKELRVRALSRDRQSGISEAEMAWQQDATLRVYGTHRPGGAIEVNCRGLSIQEAVRAVARIVFVDDYAMCDLQQRLLKYKSGRLRPPKEGPLRKARRAPASGG
jgi:hypothetical protein